MHKTILSHPVVTYAAWPGMTRRSLVLRSMLSRPTASHPAAPHSCASFVKMPLPPLPLPTLNDGLLRSTHRAPIPEDEPIPGEQPEPEEDPVPHPDPIIREPDQSSSAPMSVKDQHGGMRNSTRSGA